MKKNWKDELFSADCPEYRAFVGVKAKERDFTQYEGQTAVAILSAEDGRTQANMEYLNFPSHENFLKLTAAISGHDAFVAARNFTAHSSGAAIRILLNSEETSTALLGALRITR